MSVKHIVRSRTSESPEVADQIDVLLIRIRSDGLQLSREVLIKRLALIHHSDDEHLDVAGVCVSGRILQPNHVPLVHLAVCDHHRHSLNSRAGRTEQLIGPMDGTSCVGSLPHVGHSAYCRFQLVSAQGSIQITDHGGHVAVQHNPHMGDVGPDGGVVDQAIYKVLYDFEVVRTHTLGAVDHKNQLQGVESARNATA